MKGALILTPAAGANRCGRLTGRPLELLVTPWHATRVSPSERPMKRVLFGFACLLALRRTTMGQTFYGVAGGLNVTRQVSVDHGGLGFLGSTSAGFAAQASIGRQLTSRHGWRVDAFVSRFAITQPSDFAAVDCAYPPPPTCLGYRTDTTTHRVDVTGVAASELVNVIPSVGGLGMYLIGGAETEYIYQHGFGFQNPSGQGNLQFGVSAGVGVTVPAGDRHQVFVEARYHRLTGARLIGATSGELTWLAPVTVGFRF